METQHVTIDSPAGSIRALCDGEIIRARGIRYAAAARFAKPQPAAPGAQDCTQPATICPQNASRLASVTGDLEQGRPRSEDCLHLSVVAPVSAKNAPVMVFFHGGAYITGGGDLDPYCPHELAKRGVVGVNVTHRLGMFGYMPVDGVAPANLGLLDQIEALRWVQRNIAAFGGDSGNVTLFGQSAGADSIYCLLVADGTDGLCHRAILQSAPVGRLYDDREIYRTLSKHAGDNLAKVDPSAVDASHLLGLTGELMKLSMMQFNSMLAFAPIFGEFPLPAEHQQRFREVAKRVPLMIGHTANEETAFMHIDTAEGAAQRQRELFSTDKLTEGLDAAEYEMVWFPEGNEFKATHCSELPLLLGDWDTWKNAGSLKGAKRDTVERLGAKVKDLWVAFARGEVAPGKKYVIDEAFA